MYLSVKIKQKMAELMELISPKVAAIEPKTEEVTTEVETELAAEVVAEVTEPVVEVALVDVPEEAIPAEETAPEEAPEDGMDMEETVKQLVDAITAIDARLKSIEDAIGAKGAEAEAKNAELAAEVAELGQKLAKQNGIKTVLKAENKNVDDYYAKIKKSLNK